MPFAAVCCIIAAMTQYHYLDDSGDPGLDGSPSSSSHFALAMVQLAGSDPLPELATLRQKLYLPAANEDDLQLADMIAGAIRQYVMGEGGGYGKTFASKVADLWIVAARRQ